MQARSIHKSYVQATETVNAVNDVSISLERGEIVSLEGPSGSGKTTLLSILGCILSPSSGDIEIDGRIVNYKRDDLSALRKQYFGFVFQQFNLFSALTVLENIEYALHIKDFERRKIRSEALKSLELVGLSERKNFLPRDLSGGQKQRVAVARAFSGNPPLLLADEPTCNLDSENALSILALFRDLAKLKNIALVIVTHDEKVRKICDRVLRMCNGEISA